MRTSRSRTIKIASALLGLGACVGLIVYLIFRVQPPKPAAVVLVGADYATNLTVPHNVLGWKGLVGIEAVSKAPRPYAIFNPASLLLIQKRPTMLSQPEQWDALIDDLSQSARSQKTILFVLALHGGTTAEGAYLIPGDMDPKAGGRLELKRVIDSMKKLPPEQNKILVLEGALISADWRLGMLYNDFARRLQDLEPEIRKVENLWVLSGCDVDQLCWTSEGLGRSAFFHYIIEALRGKAAGPDGRLTLDELHDYVLKHVRNWAWNARGVIQEPVLLPRDGQETGKSSAGTGRRSPCQVHLASVEAAPTPAAPQPADRATLEEPWRHFQELDGLVPHPSAYSPRRWREYRATLVRREELGRCGATADQVRPLDARLTTLENSLRSERYLLKLPESAQNNLVMNVVHGGVIDPRLTDQPEYLRFWSPPRGVDPSSVWNELTQAEPPASAEPRQPMRCRIDDFLIRQAAADPFHNLATAADRLSQTRGTDYPQPAEAHFLIMLQKQLDRPPNQRHPSFWPRVSQALLLRRRAERAALGQGGAETGYPYSEQVHPWIRATIEKADEQRRLGEDRIFSSEVSDWAQAQKSFATAEELYRQAEESASLVRTALAARDQILAGLPDYSRWLAHRHPEDLVKDDLSPSYGELWSQAHRLTEQLERGGDTAAAKSLNGRLVASRYDEVVQRFADQTRRFSSDRLREDYQAATAAASVAFKDSRELSLRNALWDRLETIQKHDLEVAAKGETAEPTGADRNQAVGLLRRRSRIQGSMALAVLGERWFDDPTFQDQERLERTGQRLLTPIDENDEAAKSWWKEIAAAGDAIRGRWQRIEPEIVSLTDDDGRSRGLPVFRERLQRAGRLGRIIDGGAASLPEFVPEATALERQTRVHDLLVWLARRSWLDHWYDEDPKAVKPYYRAVGLRFAGDAARLVEKSPDVAKIQQLLNQNDKLRLDGPPTLALTSERGTDLTYRIAAEGKEDHIPPGLPVVAPAADADLKLEGENNGYRLAPWRTGGETVHFSVVSPLIRDAEKNANLTRPRMTPSQLSVTGFFRGQLFESRTSIELHPQPDQVAIGLPPPADSRASIAVRASAEIINRYGEGTGSIAIVLDFSGSMRFPTASGRSKIDEAKRALQMVLTAIPAGTTVSFWIFSQVPKGTVPNVGDMILTEPERTILSIWRPMPWNPDQSQELIGKLDQFDPFCDTPLVQAMWTAANTDLKDAKGLKTLLVLTDGADNRFMENLAFNPIMQNTIPPRQNTIPDFLKTNLNRFGARINLVFFTAALEKPEELARAKADFEIPLKTLDPPGSFIAANDFDQLLRSLRRGIRQKLTCKILRPDGTPVSQDLLEVTGPGEEDKWWAAGLEPGIYKIRILADKRYDQDIDLKRGDRLVIKLVDASGTIGFERALYSDDFGTRVESEPEGWRLAGLASVLGRRGDLDRVQVLASLEEKPTAGGFEAAIEQVHPAMAWFKLDGQGIDNPENQFAVNWRYRASYISPVWQLDVPQWPRDPAGGPLATPVLRAWWLNSGRKLPPAAVFRMDAGDFPRTARIDDSNSVVVESVDIEPHLVEVEPEQRAEQSCLVIRLAFPKGSPYLVEPIQLTGLESNIVGHEHRFYTAAGKYTGLFWPVNRAQFDRLKSLGVISLAQLLGQSEKQKTATTLKLPVPKTGRLPQPPIAIRN